MFSIDIYNQDNLKIFSFIFGFILFSIFYIFFKKKEKYSHIWRKKSARKVYQKIKRMTNPQIFAYLRKIDPFVFEELILYSLSLRDDVRIEKSSRYTGDGGIDGTFYIKVNNRKRKIVIQAKRYKAHINKKHVDNFCKLISEDNSIYLGLFVHTGKTGAATKKSSQQCTKMKMYSGQSLLKLLLYSQI